MHTFNPSIALQQHLTTMPSSNSFTMSAALVSNRVGVENMDGQAILAGQTKSYARPWTGCIPFELLTKDNLPPFYVRLQDDQVGHLTHWVSTSRSSITRLKLGQFWPWDFDTAGKILAKRDNWGAEYSGCGNEKGKSLGGGKKVPAWTEPGLPLTYTSSHKVMARELNALKRSAALKRKAEEEVGRKLCMPAKKARLGSISMELKKMKETAEKKHQVKTLEKERYTGGKPELQDAMQVVDNLMRTATETANQNTVLEAMLLKNEAQYIKDTDDTYGEWLAYNNVKGLEVVRMLEDHAAEIKTRDAKIASLEVEAKASRARLEKEKQKVGLREECLGKAKTRWVENQDLIEQKLKEVEEIAVVDLDELSEFNYEDDQSDDGESDNDESDFEAEPEGNKETMMVEQKEKQKEEPKEAKEVEKELKREPIKAQEANVAKVPETKERESLGHGEPGNTTTRETSKSLDIIDVVNLEQEEGDESSDEGPISSHQKGKSRNSVRNRSGPSFLYGAECRLAA